MIYLSKPKKTVLWIPLDPFILWLIDVINDENNRGYVVVQAVESLFRIIDRGITDRENAEHIKEIKESLSALEGGRVLDIW